MGKRASRSDTPNDELANELDTESLWQEVTQPTPDASSGDGIMRTDEQCAEWAKNESCKLEKADDFTLFIDIDNEAQYASYKTNRPVFDKHFKSYNTIESVSKSGLPHRHIRIQLRESLSLEARIALQACLGSDLLRELLSIRRALNNEANVVLFFEKEA